MVGCNQVINTVALKNSDRPAIFPPSSATDPQKPVAARGRVQGTALTKGFANKEIADMLNLSEHSVEGYLKIILSKLRAADRTEAVTSAIQRGIIHL
jgi:DNA-binding NarL/FixJ family response regulator